MGETNVDTQDELIAIDARLGIQQQEYQMARKQNKPEETTAGALISDQRSLIQEANDRPKVSYYRLHFSTATQPSILQTTTRT